MSTLKQLLQRSLLTANDNDNTTDDVAPPQADVGDPLPAPVSRQDRQAGRAPRVRAAPQGGPHGNRALRPRRRG